MRWNPGRSPKHSMKSDTQTPAPLAAPAIPQGARFLAEAAKACITAGADEISGAALFEMTCSLAAEHFPADAAFVIHAAEETERGAAARRWLERMAHSGARAARLDTGEFSAGGFPETSGLPVLSAAAVRTGADGRGLLVMLRTAAGGREFSDEELAYLGEAGEMLAAAARRNPPKLLPAWEERGISWLLDAIPSLVVVIDQGGTYRYCNRATLDWTGMPENRIISQHYTEVLGEGFCKVIAPYVAPAIAGETVRFEVQVPHRDGSTRNIIGNCIPFSDESGRIEGFYGIFTDVTGLSAAQKNLRDMNLLLETKVRERTEKLSEISANVPALFYYVDRSGRFLFANKIYTDSFGQTPDGIIGKTIREVIGEELYAIAGPKFEIALEGNEVSYRNFWKRPGEPMRCYRARYTPRRDADGKIIGAYLLAMDITAEHELEQATLVAADRERESVARELHDGICQDLTAIGFFAKTIEQRLRNLGNSESDQFAELGELIRDTTEKTRSVAHGLSIAPQGMFDLAASVRAFIRLISHRPECRFRTSVTVPEADMNAETRGQLYLIAREAITNSLKHGSPTRMVIRASRVASEVRLVIADNGAENPELDEAGAGMGVRTMTYRARLLGGSMRLMPRRRKGVLAICRIPISPK